MKRNVYYWYSRIGVGSLLLVAAVFKFGQVLSDAAPAIHLWDSPRVLLLIAQLEFVLGIFVLCGIGGIVTWSAAVLLFSVFFVAAFSMALLGYEDCGCFGPVKFNPWYTAALDLTCLVALLAARSSWTPRAMSCRNRDYRQLSDDLETVALSPSILRYSILAPALIVLMAVIVYGITSTWTFLQHGHRVASPAVVSATASPLDSAYWAEAIVEISNTTGTVKRVVGVHTSCRLIAPVEQFPFELDPYEKKHVRFQVWFTNSIQDGQRLGTARFYVDGRPQSMPVTIHAQLLDAG